MSDDWRYHGKPAPTNQTSSTTVFGHVCPTCGQLHGPVTASDARPPSDTGTTHDIEVSGIWFNTGDAGVGVWCNACADWILEGDDYGDVLTPQQITSAVAAHLAALGGQGAAMTVRCGRVLPFYLTDTPVQCACGRWHAATTFHDHDLGHSWRGWDLMPDPRSTS